MAFVQESRPFESLCLGLGSNLGNRLSFLSEAQKRLTDAFGAPIMLSEMVETDAWGMTNQDAFLNQILIYDSKLEPEKVLEICQNIEHSLGRKRHQRWGPRNIDIDILFYGDLIFKSEILEIPHPYIADRRFVLEPLAAIWPNFVHPVLQKTLCQLLENCSDPMGVLPYHQT